MFMDKTKKFFDIKRIKLPKMEMPSFARPRKTPSTPPPVKPENKFTKKKEDKKNTFWSSIKEISYTRTRLSIKDQTFFVKRLSFLIKAGIPMRESLVMIREQTKKGSYGAILDTVITSVSNGQNLSSSLAKYKNAFGDFAINIIGFGEESGILSENLEYVAHELKKRQELRKKIIGASIYPIIVTLATIAVTAFLVVYLFPKILPIFSSVKMDLPLTTRIVIAVSNFIKDYGLISLSTFVVLLIIFIILHAKIKTVHFYWDLFLMKIPVIGKIVRDYNMANFTRTMGLLLRSGVTMSEALPIAVKTTSNLVYQNEFHKIGGVVNRGAKISTYLRERPKFFPDIVTQIIAVGEQSGNLSNSLIYLSEMYEADIDDFTKNLSSMVEPVLMIVMGLLVGFIAISIITPIYGITEHLKPR
jgi:type IV pilus assembly protein PilC